ncbi:hypothetical protein IC235_04140 [Hymenobacter sp. BT664]|uniref:Uncharacterized protein n=1 Tax=Hymenobacter montanus TaxID=2771359 RepID=A0A927BBG5_9BACT|nr:hypothetical protein [Hymenobacter montanus]MBD2767084.1 hypothetical protein [Hymenobacter montanus]
MKKIFLPTALLLAVATSWAFYPKATEPTGYMMVIGSATFAGFTSKAEVTVVDPTGKVSVQDVDARNGSAKKVTESLTILHQAELKKLNELKQQGWKIVQTTSQTISPPAMLTTTYVLEQQ